MSNTKKGETRKHEDIICYECNKSGHFKSDCPRLKNKAQIKKKKAMLATWEDNDESSSDGWTQEEVAQLALMAIEEEEDNVEVSSYELIVTMKIYSSIISFLNKKVKCLTIENKQLLTKTTFTLINEDKKKIGILEKEKESLKIEVDSVKKTFSNFSNSSDKLEKLLGMQRCVLDKAGLGYDEMNNVKHYQNFFERKKNIEKDKLEKEVNKKKMPMFILITGKEMDIFQHLVFTRNFFVV
ncbi:zf-CCHC domain-containing protein [Cephalotus follicularis]|uniref:Zf-CCHC domain-containing protein n=1 Tax=Cephalotus follicularis TaxID=3775 RepID=A0A1Q3CUK0_CEPFO|nr:zf-CCHC domain-containing protein [Cephalotus follicularis]